MYKVVIPSAGLGSRVGQYSKHYNKTLITVADKPVISHIIEKIPKDIEIVIILGYKGDHIRQFIELVYPNRQITFVDVDVYEGPGSGIGYSLLCAKDKLQCPFVLVTNDTIIHSNEHTFAIDPSEIGNWVGFVDVNRYDNLYLDVAQYRTIDITDDGFAATINPKGVECPYIYIGTCGINDYNNFWNELSSGKTAAIEAGESFALNGLSYLHAIDFGSSWYDTGNLGALEYLKENVLKTKYNILEKENEAIWFFGDDIVKFSTDVRFIYDRVDRLGFFKKSPAADMFPALTGYSKNFYRYKKEAGAIISDELTPEMFHHLFEKMDSSLWLNRKDPIDYTAFYKTKMYERVEDFFRRYEFNDISQHINGMFCKPVLDVFDHDIDWNWLCIEEVISCMYHGDFHNENIIINSVGNFKLIDWRQNFSGDSSIHYGDIYYDFAKFLHGLLIPYSSVMNEQFSISKDKGHSVFIDILRPYRFSEVEDELFGWIDNHGFSVKKTKLLAALIFINIAALHEQPQSHLFFYFGKYLINKWSNEE